MDFDWYTQFRKNATDYVELLDLTFVNVFVKTTGIIFIALSIFCRFFTYKENYRWFEYTMPLNYLPRADGMQVPPFWQ